MDLLGAALSAHRHVASSADLARIDLGPAAIKQLVQRGVLHRYRRGAFIDGARWRAAAPWERHELRARAVARALCTVDAPYALSHHSALALHGIGTYAVDERVHLVRVDGARGRIDPTVFIHPPLPADLVHDVEGIPCVAVPLACVQVAGSFGVEAGLVSADAALRLGRTTVAELHAAASLARGSAMRPARSLLELADARSGSAGESRTRWLLHWLGMPAPELQTPIYDSRGELVGVTDFLFREEWTIVEFDGALKYADRADLVAEKHREDRLRELGYEVVRVSWADLEHPARVVARIRSAFARAAARRARAG